MTARLSAHQFRYDLLSFLRNRQARFFTLALPVIFLVILASVIGSSAGGVTVPGGKIDLSVYYVPGIMTLGVIAASFVNLVMSVITQRETGVLKRRRATPVPAASIIAGRALTVIVVALTTSFVLLVVGWIFYGAHIPARTFPALVITIIVGAAVFCCLGYALVSAIRNEDAAQPITQAIMLPLYFISGVFYPTSGLPTWLADVAKIFPVSHLSSALLVAYNPHTTGAGFAWTDLAVLSAWGIVGAIIAMRRFSWMPRGV